MELEVQVGDLIYMQDEIVARLAGALNAELLAAEAGRAERTPTPDSMDLYFQGMALLNKAPAPDNVAQARGFFDRALTSSAPTTSPEGSRTLKGLTPYEFVCKAWASQPQRFKLNPLQQMPGLNI